MIFIVCFYCVTMKTIFKNPIVCQSFKLVGSFTNEYCQLDVFSPKKRNFDSLDLMNGE